MDAPDKYFREQTNIYRLHELVDSTILGMPGGPPFVLSENLIKRMHKVAMSGLLDSAGDYRQTEVRIQNSAHRVPSWVEVPALMGTFVEYLRVNWQARDLVHLAAFALWRLNWIHPFANGNGRTARAVCYLVLCARHGQLFPPRNSIIEQIQAKKQPYYQVLPQVDAIYASTNDPAVSVAPLEHYLQHLLSLQLAANL